jgi:hypothetical protein
MSDLVDHPEEYFRQFLPKGDQLLAGLEEEARPIIPCRYNLLTCKFLYYRDFKLVALPKLESWNDEVME